MQTNRVLLAIFVVAGVPLCLVGYILLVEGGVGRLGRRPAAAIRPWLWLGPALLFLGVFLLYPTINTILQSFKNSDGTKYVGLENYKWFFTTSDTLVALRNNVLWAVFLPLLVVTLGLVIAVLADRVKYERVVKTAIFLPMAISFVAAGVIWKLMYDIDPTTGTLNAVVKAVGHDPIAWLSTPSINNFMLIFVGVWMLAGFAMVILSAGLKGISTELLEAARIDGCNEWQVFRKISLPLLRPTTAVVATTVVIFALKTFDIVYVMTSGNFNTQVIGYQMYKELFAFGNPARSATVAVVLLLATVPVMMVNIRRFRQQEAVR
jgi:alpha-glucoside transport system permease protein